MKAVMVHAFGPVGEAAVEDVPDPVAGPGEVVMAVQAADVNFPDILVIEGNYQVKPPLPFSPGKAAAGVVESVGDGVTGLRPGDRVMALVEYGAFAEKLAVAAALCHPMPDDLTFIKAAAMGVVGMTAYYALTDRAGLQPGETVLVLGAKGGVGVAGVQVAKALGAGTVIAGLRDQGSADALRRAGADHVVDLGAPDLRDSLRDAVHAVTDGRGVDVVIDPVGGDAAAAALRTLAWRGRLVVVGFASGTIPEFKANYLLVKNITVTGLQMSDYRDRWHEATAKAQADLFRFFEAGTVDPVVSAVLPLADFAEALERIRAGGVLGKVVLEVGASGERSMS